MAVESYLKTYLFQTGKLTLPEIGTFTIRDQSATLTTDRILPPQKFIHFESVFDSEEYAKFCDEMVQKLDLNVSDFKSEVENFIETKKNELGKLYSQDFTEVKLEGLGFFTLQEGELHFKASNVNSEFWNNSFGLAPLTNFSGADSNSKSEQPHPTKKFLPWLIRITSIVILGAGGYFFYLNYAKSSPPSPKPATIVIEEAPDSGREQTTTQAKDTVKNEIKEEVSPAPPKPKIIDKPTRKYYLIVGSYLTLENAELALSNHLKAEAQKGNILISKKGYRVALGGAFTDKQVAQAHSKNLEIEGWILYY